MPLPPVSSVSETRQRLQDIFPEGTPNQPYVVREMAAKTVFVMLYIGAVEGAERWLRPDQVTRMTDEQAALTDDDDRHAWEHESMRPTGGTIVDRWYAADTREPIRDESLRNGLVRMGAVRELEGLATTSPQPRYALAAGFAALFDPVLSDEPLERAISEWREANLSSVALARIALLRQGAVAQDDQVAVTFPNGETRQMASGPSSLITKAVVEEFAAQFLEQPGVVWLSESRRQVVSRDDELAQAIGLTIDPQRNLPDLILVDLGPTDPLVVFVEVVATSGPVSEPRRAALMAVANEAGFGEHQVAFVTAFADRSRAAFRRAMSELAWRSFAWFASEPDHILVLHEQVDSENLKLSDLMRN